MSSLETITYGTDSLPAHVTGVRGAPAVIAVQEWWGVTPIIKRQAAALAAKGYRVFIPDLYRGKLGVEREEAQHLYDSLDWPAAVRQLAEAAEHLRSEGSPTVGALGFCMGGALALATAQHGRLDAAVGCYGSPPAALGQPEEVRCPVLLVTGEEDNLKGFSDPDTMRAWASRAQAAGKDARAAVYPRAGHGFLNEGDDAVATRKKLNHYEPDPTQQLAAWEEIFAYLDSKLKQ
ncbi:dienelactone hydrolase [Helicosporidium sp. ATCC 50920]|nr:dienelactone hydrolase [Helicosporidium sp. ATCC 50920]|eukprot:KDD72688.1 dienelactone hydrolase [Helicosporidium sp. ATCC 50920]